MDDGSAVKVDTAPDKTSAAEPPAVRVAPADAAVPSSGAKGGAAVGPAPAGSPAAPTAPKSVAQNRPSAAGSGNRPSSGSASSQAPARSSPVGVRRGLRRRNQTSQLADESLNKKQMELRMAKFSELRERFMRGDEGYDFNQDKKYVKKLTNNVAYRDIAEYPRDLRPSKIDVDNIHECLLIPYENTHIPYHISMLRNISHQDEEGKHILRFVFNCPTTYTSNKETQTALPDLSEKFADSLFVKEMIVQSNDSNIPQLFKSIKDLMKKFKDKDEADDERGGADGGGGAAGGPTNLIINRSGRNIVLRSVYVRHSGGYQRKSMGQLEAHINGFRYLCPRMEAIDILYSNVKHIFFQPVNNEMIVLIHLHLKYNIVINKKKIKDIQFYSETNNSSTDDLDHRKNHRSAYDPDEILEEQKDRDRRHKLNIEYKKFLEQLINFANGQSAAGASEAASAARLPPLEIPNRKLSFHGVPRNSSVLLSPTTRALVHLTEWPPFVLTLEDIELVSLERVVHGLRHFDMIFIFKDYNKAVTPIYNIPIESLDMIKVWLNDIDLVWYQGRNNLTWSNILKHIKAHIKDFIGEGGFASFLGDELSERAGGEGVNRKGKVGSSPGNAPMSDDDDDDDDEEFVDEESEDAGSSDDDEDEEDADDDEAGSDDEDDDEDDEDDEDDDSEDGSAEEGSSDEDDDDELEDDSEEDDEPKRPAAPQPKKSPQSGGIKRRSHPTGNTSGRTSVAKKPRI